MSGQFDLLVDYGTFDDLSTKDRAAYVDQVMSLAKPGAKFLLWCFEWELKVWERVATAVLPFGNIALQPGEVERWFASTFEITRIAGESDLPKWPRGWAAYLLTRTVPENASPVATKASSCALVGSTVMRFQGNYRPVRAGGGTPQPR